MSLQSATAWRKPRPWRAPSAHKASPIRMGTAKDAYGRDVAFAQTARNEGSGRAASLIDVIHATQAKANELGKPLEVVRVYILRGKDQCRAPTLRDFSQCAARYTAFAEGDFRTKYGRLQSHVANNGTVYHYVMTVYPEADALVSAEG